MSSNHNSHFSCSTCMDEIHNFNVDAQNCNVTYTPSMINNYQQVVALLLTNNNATAGSASNQGYKTLQEAAKYGQ